MQRERNSAPLTNLLYFPGISQKMLLPLQLYLLVSLILFLPPCIFTAICKPFLPLRKRNLWIPCHQTLTSAPMSPYLVISWALGPCVFSSWFPVSLPVPLFPSILAHGSFAANWPLSCWPAHVQPSDPQCYPGNSPCDQILDLVFTVTLHRQPLHPGFTEVSLTRRNYVYFKCATR